jgi:hypothetical protein
MKSEVAVGLPGTVSLGTLNLWAVLASCSVSLPVNGHLPFWRLFFSIGILHSLRFRTMPTRWNLLRTSFTCPFREIFRLRPFRQGRELAHLRKQYLVAGGVAR